MQRQERVLPVLHAVSLRHLESKGAFPVCQERINHHVPDKVDPFGCDALAVEVVVGRRFSCEQHLSQLIGQHPIDFLRHSSVGASQPGFHMRHGHAHFRGDQRTGESGVHVSDDDDQVTRPLQKDRLKAGHDGRGLLRVAP